MGNANPNDIICREITETDDADRLAELMTAIDDRELMSMAEPFYHNGCVKCLRLLEHRHDQADPELKDKWLLEYHLALNAWEPDRVIPELIELILDHERFMMVLDQKLAIRRAAMKKSARPIKIEESKKIKKSKGSRRSEGFGKLTKFHSITTSPETRLGLAIYYDDPAAVQQLIDRYPRKLNKQMGRFCEVMDIARRPNHQGQMTAPKIVAQFPQYINQALSLNDLMAVVDKHNLGPGLDRVTIDRPNCKTITWSKE